MSDLKLFRVVDGRAVPVSGGTITLEKHLQTVIERNMDALFAVRFVASEFSTGVRHGGRIDSLGLDENGSPVIFEYKRAVNENVINQGLFYLDWLMDHRGDFTVLVQQKLGAEQAESVDWTAPRLVCVAGDFTKYDEHAIAQMGRSIELVRYLDFEGGLLALELVASSVAQATPHEPNISRRPPTVRGRLGASATVTELLEKSPEALAGLYADLDAYLRALGDDVTMTTRKLYFAYRRIKNFACVEVHPTSGELLVYAKVDPSSIDLAPGFTRDVRNIGHFGTGDLEIKLKTKTDLDKALPLLQTSYDNS